MYGIQNYLPALPHGEDEETMKQYIKIMQSEAKKVRQDVHKIEHLMTITLADRREKIVNERRKVSALKDCYPCLFNEDEVSTVQQKFHITNEWHYY